MIECIEVLLTRHDRVHCLCVRDTRSCVVTVTVTTFSNATEALKMLRTKKELVDIVLSDVHMPDMDGFKLLEAVGLDLNIPVISMSAPLVAFPPTIFQNTHTDVCACTHLPGNMPPASLLHSSCLSLSVFVCLFTRTVYVQTLMQVLALYARTCCVISRSSVQ